MAVPEDSGDVSTAIRLGWYVAEVRGRIQFAVEAGNRKGPGGEPGAQLKLPKRTDHELPLEMERSPAELRIEAQAVLSALAGQIGVDLNHSRSSFSGEVNRRAKRLAGAPRPAGALQSAAAVLAGMIRRLSGAAKTRPVKGRTGTAKAADAGKPGAAKPGAAKPGARAEARAGTSASNPAKAAAPADATGGAGVPRGDAGGQAPGPAAGAAKSLVAVLDSDGAADGDWDALEEVLYKFDAHIQDTLIAKSDTMSSGYQLGRALAECYWALDPSLPGTPETWASWTFLLGQGRCAEIGRLLGRLSPYFHPYTAAAIAGSVQIWTGVAKSPAWRTDAYPHLYAQIRGWYELILMKQDPTTLIQPYRVLTNYRLVLRTLRGFWVQLLTAALAAGAVAVFAWLLTKPGFSSWVKTLLAALGIAGFSVAGLTAKVKNEAQAMLTRLKQDAYTDLITEAITTAPLPPRSVSVPKSGLIGPLTRKGKMTSLMRQRSITPITPV